jgi:hypothetical protein
LRYLNGIGNHIAKAEGIAESVMFVMRPCDFFAEEKDVITEAHLTLAVGLPTSASVALHQRILQFFLSPGLEVGAGHQLVDPNDFIFKLKTLFDQEESAIKTAGDDHPTLQKIFGYIAPITFMLFKYGGHIAPDDATGDNTADYRRIIEALAGHWLTIIRGDYFHLDGDDSFTVKGCNYMLSSLQARLFPHAIAFACFPPVDEFGDDESHG